MIFSISSSAASPAPVRAALALAWAALIFLLSSLPGREVPLPPLFPNFDKVAHLGAYAVLGMLLLRAGRPEWIAPSPRWGWLLLCAALVSLYGASDEWHQSFVPDRSCSVADWVVDSIGAVLGEAAWLWICRERPSLRLQAQEERTGDF